MPDLDKESFSRCLVGHIAGLRDSYLQVLYQTLVRTELFIVKRHVCIVGWKHTNVGHHPDEIFLDVRFKEQSAMISQNRVKARLKLTLPIVLQI